jgi:hypothetical protein
MVKINDVVKIVLLVNISPILLDVEFMRPYLLNPNVL